MTSLPVLLPGDTPRPPIRPLRADIFVPTLPGGGLAPGSSVRFEPGDTDPSGEEDHSISIYHIAVDRHGNIGWTATSVGDHDDAGEDTGSDTMEAVEQLRHARDPERYPRASPHAQE